METVQPPGNGGTEKWLPLMHFPNGPADVLNGGLFEQKSRRAGLGRGFDIGVITVRGEHEHLGGGEGGAMGLHDRGEGLGKKISARLVIPSLLGDASSVASACS
jgi:hypothetical protein